MAEQVTNLQLSKDIGDLKGAVGRIEGLLVGISSDLVSGRAKFIELDGRLRKVEIDTSDMAEDRKRVDDVDIRLQSAEKKIAVYTAIAGIGATIAGILGQFVLSAFFS